MAIDLALSHARLFYLSQTIRAPIQLQPLRKTMLVSLTVGKVDAGVAVLLTEDKRLVNSHPQQQPQYTTY